MVSRAQLVEEGIPPTTLRDRVRRGQLVLLHRGVYAVGHAHLRPNGYRLAAVLAVGPGAALSHRDAAALHGLRDGGGVRIDVSTPAERRSTRRIRVHGRRRLDPADVTTVEGIEEAIGRLRGRRGQSAAKMRAALADLAHHGTTLTRSPLEDRLLPLLDAHDLPRPATNAYVEGYEGDAVWHRHKLVVELDGWDAHKTRRAFQHDRTKANALTDAGWTVLRFTHADLVRRPRETAAAIARQLSRAA